MFNFLILIALALVSFFVTRQNIIKKKSLNIAEFKSVPNYYGYCSSIYVVFSAIALLVILSFSGELSARHFLLFSLVITFVVNFVFRKKITGKFNARKHFEKIFVNILRVTSIISILITFFIVASILVEAIKFFSEIPLHKFLFGTEWSPQTAGYKNSAENVNSFGALPIFTGTLLITLIAISIAVPFGIYSAVYLTEYSSKRFRKIAKPILEILAGVPTVVYGYFAAFVIAPFLQNIFGFFDISIASESALAAGLVMGIMITPFVLSLSDDVMNSVPESLRAASLSMGATKSETIKKVVIPAAIPGISGAVLLAISRAIGETMIVTMAAGLNANLTANPLESVTTATAQIVTLLVGDQEFDSLKTLAAFALGITLFVITLTLNLVALLIVKKYREKYD